MMTFDSVADKNRFRFNSGFHDAQSDASNQRHKRGSTAIGRQYPLPKGKDWLYYRLGYEAGWSEWRETRTRNESSEVAWQKHKAETR